MLILWRPNDNVYDARILFAIGGLSSLISTLYPFGEIFLCVECCIIAVFPLKYTGKLKIIFSFLSLSEVIVTHGFVFVQSSLCIGFIFPPQYAQLIKVLFAALNTIPVDTLVPAHATVRSCCKKKVDKLSLCFNCPACCAHFLSACAGTKVSTGIVYKFTNETSKNAKHMNKTITHFTVATMFIDLIPNVIEQLFFYITAQQLFDITGPFSLTASNISSTISLWLCYQAIKKSFNTLIIVSPQKVKTNVVTIET